MRIQTISYEDEMMHKYSDELPEFIEAERQENFCN